MDTLPNVAKKHLLVFLLSVTLLGGCTAVPPEPYPQSPPQDSDPVSKTHEATPPVTAAPPIDTGPVTRHRAVPPSVDRPIPARPPPQATAAPLIQPVPSGTAVQPAAPVPVQVCDPGGCFGPAGNRYSGGIGNIYLDSNGKTCRRMGDWMQCN